MSKRILLVAVLALLLAPCPLRGASPALTVVSAGPTGEVASLAETNEVRVVFSEPMVVLGRIPQPVRTPFFRIAPAVLGTFRWSGTTILIFTPGEHRPLPFATKYTVTIDATATAVSGRRLAKPYVFTFTTPTVRLLSATWARRNSRYSEPAMIFLHFNQPVRPGDIAAHLSVRFVKHEWKRPDMQPQAIDRLKAADPQALAAFDTKVAATERAVAAESPATFMPATDWDRTRHPPSPDLVVLQSTMPIPTDSWVRLTLDTRVTGLQGRETPARPQEKVLQFEPTLFIDGFECKTECNPDNQNSLEMRRRVDIDSFRKGIAIADITDPKKELPVRATRKPSRTLDYWHALTIEDAGFPPQPPARTYAVRLAPTLTAQDGQTLGYTWLGIVENWHQLAFTSFGDGHGVWEKASGPKLPFYARNFLDVKQWLAPIAVDQLMPTIRALQPQFTATPPGEGVARKLAPTLDKIQSYGIDISKAVQAQGTGLLWAAVQEGRPITRSKPASAPGAVKASIVQATNLGMTVKDSPQNTLVFVTRLDTGEPVAQADVSIIRLDNTAFWKGTTDEHGLALAPDTRLRGGEGGENDRYEYRYTSDFSFIVVAQKDGDIAYLGSDWNEGIHPWEFGLSYNLREADPMLRGTVFTDRGVYRLGEEVHLKAVLRSDTPQGVKLLPKDTAVDVLVKDSQDRDVDKRTVRVNDWSTAEWTMTVPPDGSLGTYNVSASMHQAKRVESVSNTFLVAAYRRPEFRVDPTLTGPPLAGTTLKGAVTARYLFGAPMANRPVRWSFTRSPRWEAPAAVEEHFADARFVFVGDHAYEEVVQQVASDEAKLDAKGTLSLNLDTALEAGHPYVYTLEGEVEDLSRQTIAGRTSMFVHPAPWYIGVKAPGYFVDEQKGLETEIVAVSPEGKVVAGVQVDVSLHGVQWKSVRRAEGKRFYTWETRREEREAGSWTVTTADRPVPLKVPTTGGGYFTLTASARDEQGHLSVTRTSFYGVGPGYTAWARYDLNRIDLTPERKTYKPGEAARIMIQSPWEHATALVTTEREGVRSQKPFTLTSTTETVTVPIGEADIPNVFVSVLLVKGRTKADVQDDDSDPGKPSFRLGYVELKVEDATKRLAVAVKANKEEYRPANAAKVDVDVKDAQGKPDRAEVTLWAVDYGVLSLTAFRTPDVLDSVYIEKALQVATTDNRQRIISRRVLTPKGAGEGGGGGAEAGVSTIRKDFRVLAFWLGSVVTDNRGHASVDVKLPESLTTYRIMAVAGDQASRFGSGESEIRINKPVLLRAAFPRFLAVGDKAFFGAVVNSQLQQAGAATVAIRSLDPAVLTFEGAGTQTLQIGAAGSAEVRFDAMARTVGRARVQMTVKLNNETDAFEDAVPVEILHSPETVAAYGETANEASERVALPAGVVPAFGGLHVELSSTAMVGLGEGARFLVEYPYGCAEQRGSRALALLLAADLGDAFKLPGIDPKDLRTRVQEALRELRQYQCPDGGFAYWPGECWSTSPYLTAYLLHVFQVAASLKHEVDAEMRNRAYTYLERELAGRPPVNEGWWPSYTAWQAFAVKVLVEGGRNQDSNITRLYGYLDRMPIFGIAYLYDALVAKGEKGTRVDEVRRRMANAILPEGGSAHVEELSDPYLLWFWNSNIRSTAIVLGSLARNAEAEPGLTPIVRWLLAARKGGRWGNTQENAWAMEGLVSYYKKYEAQVPDFTATTTLGSQQIGRDVFKGRSAEAKPHDVPMPQLLQKGKPGSELDLKFRKQGTGTLFYSARLRYTADELYQQGMDNGFLVERQYAPASDVGAQPPKTSYDAGDLVKITLTFTLTKERRFVAVADPLPAGFEPVEAWFATTAADLARAQEKEEAQGTSWAWWERGGFDHVERHDDKVLLFATRLSDGKHQFSYLARATTAGTFRTAPTHAEEMYEPEVFGRTRTDVVEVKR